MIVAGFGAGAAVFDAVATAAVNPGDASPDPTTGYYGKVKKQDGVRLSYRIPPFLGNALTTRFAPAARRFLF